MREKLPKEKGMLVHTLLEVGRAWILLRTEGS